MVRDIDYAKPMIQGVLDDAYNNPRTTVASTMAAVAGSVFGGYRAQNTHLGIQALAALGGGLAATAITFDVSKAGAALWDTVSQNAANGWMKDVLHDVWGDPNTAAACVSQGMIAGTVVGSYFTRNTNSVIQTVAIPTIGLAVAALRYGAGKVGTALSDAVSQSSTNGWMKAVFDYAYDNPITTAVSGIAGIAGLILGPLYSQAAVDALALHDQITANFQTVVINGWVGATHQMLTDLYAAQDNACYGAIVRQNLGRGLVTGLSAAIIPHVLNYVGKTIYSSCTDQDGYCNQGMTAISNIRKGL